MPSAGDSARRITRVAQLAAQPPSVSSLRVTRSIMALLPAPALPAGASCSCNPPRSGKATPRRSTTSPFASLILLPPTCSQGRAGAAAATGDREDSASALAPPAPAPPAEPPSPEPPALVPPPPFVPPALVPPAFAPPALAPPTLAPPPPPACVP